MIFGYFPLQKALFFILLWLPLSAGAEPVIHQFDGLQSLHEQPNSAQSDGEQSLDEQPNSVQPITDKSDSLCKHVNHSMDHVIVGVDEYPPWSYLQDNKAMGIDVD